MSVVGVRDLRVRFGETVVVEGVSFDVAPGECLAIVGESGAGKSLTALALLGLTPEGARVDAAELRIDGVEMRRADERAWRGIRGDRIGLVSQDALVSLDPLRRVGAEVAEPLEIHTGLGRTAREARVLELLRSVAMPDPAVRAGQYPHELSGGLRQRALIASALAAAPRVLVADEPTTALDATVQVRVLALLRDVVDAGVGLVFISHDLAAVARVADRVAVMRGGRTLEHGPLAEVLAAPRHPYTRSLIDAAGFAGGERGTEGEADAATGAPEPPVVLRAEGLRKAYGATTALAGASFALRAGRTLGIVGESGAGKTTLARLLLGIETPDAGEVELDGEPWNPVPEAARRARRTRIQLVHQNPRAAFDPRWSIGRSLREALAAGGIPRAARPARVADLLRQVELDPALASRRAGQLSGGQRQRAAIVRALATAPDVLVLDEPVSALDVAVQQRILALLARLQRELGLVLVIISHDLHVIRELADDVLVMQRGHVVEQGAAAQVFAEPTHPFTRELLAAASVSTR